MKAISRRLGVFKFFGRNPKIIGRRLTHVTTTRQNITSDSGRPRTKGLNNKLTVRIAGYMGAEKEVGVDFTDDMQRDETMRRLVPGGPFHTSGAAGSANVHYSDSAAIITLDRSVIADPARLIAVIAHEIGHVRLMGERGVDSSRKDNEPLTDLATVYLGLGIFTANAAFDFSQRRTGWKARHLGYLTAQMFGYALARYTLLRGDPKPSWARHLDTNPRVYMKNAIRYLQHQSD